MTTVESYEDCVTLVNSFYWDVSNQIAYFNFEYTNPHTLTSIDLARVYGATDESAIEFDGILYPTILVSKPNIVRSIEPVVYEKMATQSVNIELRNDVLWRSLEDGTLESYHRFDDLSDIVGQTTYVRYGADDSAYEDLKVLHKGVVTDYTIESMSVTLTCEDKRSKLNNKWPNYTYADAGYTSDDIEEDLLTKVIPDGYGDVKEIPAICVDRSNAVLQFDDDTDELLNPPTNMVDYDLATWNAFDADVVKSDKSFGGFPLYTLQKTAGNIAARLTKVFAATETIHRVSGYLVHGSQETIQKIGIYDTITMISTNVLNINFTSKTYSVSANTQNVRVKFIEQENEPVAVYYSLEYTAFVVGRSFAYILYIDDSTTANTIGYASGIRVTVPEYIPFRCARLLTSVAHVYKKEKDDELVEITPLTTDLDNGIITLYDCDAHVDGLMSNDLIEIFVDCRLRNYTNPMDIIIDLNLQSAGLAYVDSLYNKDIISSEKMMLADVSLYKDAPTELYSMIGELQNGSTVGFRYDDTDKIYMMVDNPNRDIAYYFKHGQIVNRGELVHRGNTTLYADIVTVSYQGSFRESKDYTYENKTYQHAVLLRYNYSNPRTFESLLNTEADAENKSIILLEDLSVTRPLVDIVYHGLDILNTLDLYSVVMAELWLSTTRLFMGTLRCQIIGIEVDTEFELVTFTLRQRDYSDAFGDITGEYGPVIVVGDEDTEIALGDETTEIAIGHYDTI
jgi:hypothetical protein